MRVECFAQEHNTVSPARARTQTARSGEERTNHETTVPPTKTTFYHKFCSLFGHATHYLFRLKPFSDWLRVFG